MYIVDRNNVIILNRGDSISFPVEILGGKFPDEFRMELDSTDMVYFGLMEPHQLFEDAIIKKVYTSEDVNEEGCIDIRIEPIDTVDLLPGTYYYSVKLSSYDREKDIEYVDTLIQKTKFIIVD